MSKQVYAVVLAAGSSTRFGGVKQLAEIGGKPLVRHAVETANSACGDRTLLVAGYESTDVIRGCVGLPGFIVVNDAYGDGMGTSIARAVRSVTHVADAVIILLADQPLITAKHLCALIENWSGDDNAIVASGFAGTQGPPVLFGRGCFDDLMQLQGDNGGRQLLDDRRFEVTIVDFEEALVDIDTPEDLRQI